MVALYNIPHIDQVYMLFRGRLLDLGFGPGDESLEVKLVAEDEIPWDQLAFATVRNTLRRYYADRQRGEEDGQSEKRLPRGQDPKDFTHDSAA